MSSCSPPTDEAQLGGPRAGPAFQNLHRNKRSLTLDLEYAEGHAAFLRLADTADVVVENFRPDVKTRLGLDYDTLSRRNPRLVYASISGFGQDGPLAHRPVLDQFAQGSGGLMSITGKSGEGPTRLGIPIADLCAGLFAAPPVRIAPRERHGVGSGQWVQTSLLRAQAFMLGFQAARFLVEGEVPGWPATTTPPRSPPACSRPGMAT